MIGPSSVQGTSRHTNYSANTYGVDVSSLEDTRHLCSSDYALLNDTVCATCRRGFFLVRVGTRRSTARYALYITRILNPT